MGDGPRSASPVTVLVLTGTGWAARTLSVARQTVPDVSLLACRHVDELESIADRAPSPAAALLDGRHPEVDRDLVAGLADLGLGVVVVDQPDRHHRWRPLGATATVPTDASVEATLSAAVRAARGPIGLGGVPSSAIRTGAAPLVAVVGCADLAARVGADLAAELARRAADPAEVLLIDATRRSRLRSPLSLPCDGPGLQDLAVAHHRRDPDPAELARSCRTCPTGHLVLPGLRAPEDWVLLRPRATAAALEAMRSSSSVTVALVDDDLDDERSTGSVGIEDRNLLARLIVSAADVVAIVAAPAPWGTEDLEHLHARSRALARRDARFVISQAARPSDAWRARPLTELLVALARADGPTPIQAPPPVAIEPGELGGWDDRC